MSLAELFSAKQAFRKAEKVRRRLRRTTRPSALLFEPLEPRVLLSATPNDVVAPQDLTTAAVTGSPNALPNLDVDLNGHADALTDGLLIVRYLFGFTGTALTNGVVDPTGQRTDPTAITTYLNGIKNTMLDVDLNGHADALTDGLLIVRNLFGFTGSALTTGRSEERRV